MNRVQKTKRDYLLGVDADMLPLRFKMRREHGKKVRKVRRLPKYDREVRT